MPMTKTPTEKQQSVLIITSSGGGGLLQTARAKEQEVLRRDPNATVSQKNLLKECFWNWFGNMCIALWDQSQRRGSVRALTWILEMQKYFDVIFGSRILIWVFRLLMRENADRVLDTQPMGTSSIIKAIRLYNFIRKKNVVLEKIMVDLPTKQATHYFRSIKKLSPKDKKCLKIVTIPPLLEKDQTQDSFWQQHCGINDCDIQYEEFYIREGFHSYRNKERANADFSIKVAVKNQEELELLQKTYGKGQIKAKLGKDTVEFTIGKNDRLITVLLGSQPASGSTFNYVKNITKLIKETKQNGRKTHLFVFCSEHIPGKNSLHRKIHDHVTTMDEYPSELSIIPMSFQQEDVIAALFFRSDMTFTRSGGQTSMELMSIMKGNIMIHSETIAKGAPLTDEELLEGIPGWEAGNACYLKEKSGANIVTPETFGEFFKASLLKGEKSEKLGA